MNRPFFPWLPVRNPEPGFFADARHQAINAVQWLARVANSYVDAEPAAKRLSLRWRALEAAVVTEAFAGDMALAMRLPDLTLQFLKNGRPTPHCMPPEGRSPAEVEAWVLVELLHRGVDRDRFSKTLPYALAKLMTGDAGTYAPESCEAELKELLLWYQNAAAAFEHLDSHAGLPAEPLPRIECWPHNLHLTSLAPALPGGQERFCRLGFSPGDESNPEPYFYVGPGQESDLGAVPSYATLRISQLLAGQAPEQGLIRFLETTRAELQQQ